MTQTDNNHGNPFLMAVCMTMMALYNLTTSEVVTYLTIIVLILTAISQATSIWKNGIDIKRLGKKKEPDEPIKAEVYNDAWDENGD